MSADRNLAILDALVNGDLDDLLPRYSADGDEIPACETCDDRGCLTVPVGPVDFFGNQVTEEAACPACPAGDAYAVMVARARAFLRTYLATPVVVERRNEPRP